MTLTFDVSAHNGAVSCEGRNIPPNGELSTGFHSELMGTNGADGWMVPLQNMIHARRAV